MNYVGYLSLLAMLADISLLDILFSGLDGPPLDMALKLPVILDWPLQPELNSKIIECEKAEIENLKGKSTKNQGKQIVCKL